MPKGDNFVGGFEEEQEPTTVEERALVILGSLLEPLVGVDLIHVRLIAEGMLEMDDGHDNLGTEIGEMLQRACTILEEFAKIEQEE
jgi:hypothetical protein